MAATLSPFLCIAFPIFIVIASAADDINYGNRFDFDEFELTTPLGAFAFDNDNDYLTSRPAPSFPYGGTLEDDDDFTENSGDTYDSAKPAKTIRVSFVIREPYDSDFSKEHSPKFQEISRKLATAVTDIYDRVDGQQKASLVRIQTDEKDDLACKVTLDITTIGNDDTDQLMDKLKRKIKEEGRLNDIVVSADEFYYKEHDVTRPQCTGSSDDSDDCFTNGEPELEINPEDYTLQPHVENNFVPSGRCDDQKRCSETSSMTICESQFCDGVPDCPDGEDEWDCPTIAPIECSDDEIVCDVNRCVPKTSICDRIPDCTDGIDEKYCNKCRPTDFTCHDSQCVPKDLVCNGRRDCPDGSDELNCCGRQQFECRNGGCIEDYKRCDNYADCPDGSDEQDCPNELTHNVSWSGVHICYMNGQFMCGDGTCISALARCDGLVDCPKDSADETDCSCTSDQWQCDYGACISRSKKCDGHIDCPTDRSDERNCFECDATCDNGKCINKSMLCNQISDCDDGFDERDCDDCNEDQFRCNDGACIAENKYCDGTADCVDSSDENCQYPPEVCEKDQFHCTSGECILKTLECDGTDDCEDGSDEQRCDTDDKCPPGKFFCDNLCLDSNVICNNIRECPSGKDEINCNNIENCPYRCNDGSCIQADEVCNSIRDCSDGEDEDICDELGRLVQQNQCEESQFPCTSGGCVPNTLRCDNVYDCRDFSDEQNCFNSVCSETQWECEQGNCIDIEKRCDGNYDCPSISDEIDCPVISTPRIPEVYECQPYEWRCNNGDCILKSKVCDRNRDCRDGSDEYSCIDTTRRPIFTTTSSPASKMLNLKTYPNQQIIKQSGEVVFQCRDESFTRAPVKWSKDGGRLPPGSTDERGRLVMPNISVSDSGDYVCRAVDFPSDYPGSQIKVHLTVEPYNQTSYRPICKMHEATCANNECIPKSSVCDGRNDCRDGSDEIGCVLHGKCEPNEFRCANRRCIYKTWVCDSQDDCKDGSDEVNCQQSVSGTSCLLHDFRCDNDSKCIPKYFHCDGENDCADGSDEFRCSKVYISTPPPPMVVLQPGQTMVLTCIAKGVPEPEVIWRLNWRHIPEKCAYDSVNGIGTLTCPDIQQEDQGAYSCEALNNRGSVFATPDTILIVNQTSDVCPAGYFNIEARQPQDCISCFCFGVTTRCRSADLFTYHLPHLFRPSQLVGVIQTPGTPLQITDEPISDIFDFREIDDGAIVSRLDVRSSRNTYPYLALPEPYHKNQLTSYGGYIKYKIRPNSDTQTPAGYMSLPDIIIKGGGGTVITHKVSQRLVRGQDNDISVRIFEGQWQKVTTSGSRMASRADIMIVLADVEALLLKGEEGGNGVQLTRFQMDSASADNTGLGLAAFVEECSCPVGYSGLSCQKCGSGYIRAPGKWLGQCVRAQPPCEAGFYGNPNAGIPCRPCPCPLTEPRNRFASTCSLGSDGLVKCDCFPGYIGNRCETCDVGYIGNPTVPGDSCRYKPAPPPSNCDSRGTTSVSESNGVCQCKPNVRGSKCSECAPNHFYLSEDNENGCSRCFCTGVTTVCSSSTWRKNVIEARFGSRFALKSVRLKSVGDSVVENENILDEDDLELDSVKKEVSYSNFDNTKSKVYYWALPDRFIGDKVTAYGGFLTYTIRHVPSPWRQNSRNNFPDIQLASKNGMTFVHYSSAIPDPDGYIRNSVQLLEKYWQRTDGLKVDREFLLMALSDLKDILIKATYTNNTQQASLSYASLEVAEERGVGDRAFHVEHCQCPEGYIGTSCEDCAPGYTRDDGGLYLGECKQCECSGHSEECHPETGECRNCRDNTQGRNCENCIAGYEKDPNNPDNCISVDSECRCDPNGTLPNGMFCDRSQPYCRCKANVEGEFCNVCKSGTFKLSGDNVYGCMSCYCSALSVSCTEAVHLNRLQIPSEIVNNTHDFTLTTIDQQQTIDRDFQLVEHLNQIGYIFRQTPNERWFWSLPPRFTGNAIRSYGGNLMITQKYETSADREEYADVDVILVSNDKRLSWKNPIPIRRGVSQTYSVPLKEDQWNLYNIGEAPKAVSRSDMLSVLADINSILVRATLGRYTSETFISDVAMDTAIEAETGGGIAENIELCRCPPGYTGTSCESCSKGYYKRRGQCERCPCSDREESCFLNLYDSVECVCQSMYEGSDCSQLKGENIERETTTEYIPPPPTIHVVIIGPVIQIKQLGENATFKCSAKNQFTNDVLDISWSKENGYLPYRRTIEDPSQGLLIITNLIESDSGTYICESYDGNSQGSSKVTLVLNSATRPSVTVYPPYLEIVEGDPMELICEATGNPAPTLRWERTDRRPLNSQYTSENGVLLISSARLSDRGEYSCIASNSAGDSQRTVSVSVTSQPERPEPTVLVIQPRNGLLREGSNMRYDCHTEPETNAELYWSRVGGYLPPNFESQGGILYIKDVRYEDAGIYVCSAYGSDITQSEVEIIVQRQGNLSPSTANVFVEDDNVIVPEGGTKVIKCEPSGNPLPEIKWVKTNSEFESSTYQRGNALVISQATWLDRGTYNCLGIYNGDKVAEKFVSVIIERRAVPVIEIYPSENVSVLKGTDVDLQCRIVRGTPEPMIIWQRPSGRPLDSNVHLRPEGILRIDNIDFNQKGIYTCTASNTAGSVSANINITIQTYPELEVRPYTTIVSKPGSSVFLECIGKGLPVPTVYWRRITYDREEELTRKTYGYSNLTLNDVNEDHAGTYSCIGTNSNGIKEERVTVNIDDEPGRGDIPGTSDDENEYRTANEGESVELRCNPVYPGSRVTWRRTDDLSLPVNSRQSNQDLYINNVMERDSGVYECIVYQPNGAIISRVMTTLVIRRPLRIVLQPTTQTVRPGDIAYMKCIATGELPISIRWNLIPENKTLPPHVIQKNGLLTFNGIKLDDAGKYLCTASNHDSIADAIAEVIVNEKIEAKHEASMNQRVTEVTINKKIEIYCEAWNSDKCNNITWTKNGNSLPTHIDVYNNGKLVFKNVHYRDKGRYECRVTDRRGKTSESHVYLKVTGRIPNSVAISPQRLVVEEGEPISVSCRTVGENFDIRWSKESSRQRVNQIPTADGLILQINQVTANDAGIYRCDGRDRNGQSHYQDFTLIVSTNNRRSANYHDMQQDAPEIFPAPLGSTIEMPCSTDMPPPISYEWERPYVELPKSLKAKSHVLKLVSVNESDAGPYICKTNNGVSYSQKKIILKVTHIIPQFDGDGYVALKPLSDVYYHFDIEIAIKPKDVNGVILYNSQNPGRQSGDFIALYLVDGRPEFQFSFGGYPTVIKAEDQLSLDDWHVISISRVRKHAYMKVDGNGPYNGTATGKMIGLDLLQPLYIGGVHDYQQLPNDLIPATGFTGCVGKLLFGNNEVSLMRDAEEKVNINGECNSCNPNQCFNNGVCQEALTNRGYVCLCPEGYSGLDCSQTGDACRPGLCGQGRCTDTENGFKCICPIGFMGERCDTRLDIEYPAFSEGAYIAYSSPNQTTRLNMELRIKPNNPVRDGVILYCAESRQGHGHFISLTVKDGHLEFRFDLGSGPVVMRSEKPLKANQWISVKIYRLGLSAKLSIEGQRLQSVIAEGTNKSLYLKTPLYLGGYDDKWLTMNKGVGVEGGFYGCISDVKFPGSKFDIMSGLIQSANILECSDDEYSDVRETPRRGDISPEETNQPSERVCDQCKNGGYCSNYDEDHCTCLEDYYGTYCEYYPPCNAQPCQGNGTCRNMDGLYKCDCPLGTGGNNCQKHVKLEHDCSLTGEGYVELPSSLLPHSSEIEIIAIAFTTSKPNGLLILQEEIERPSREGDFMMLNIKDGYVEFLFKVGETKANLTNRVYKVSDNQRHEVIVRRQGTFAALEVGNKEEFTSSLGATASLNANSNIYIGGTPNNMISYGVTGFNGCIHQIEFQETGAIDLGKTAIASRNANSCTNFFSYRNSDNINEIN